MQRSRRLLAAAGAVLVCGFGLAGAEAATVSKGAAAKVVSDVPLGLRMGIVRLAASRTSSGRFGGGGERDRQSVAFADTAGNMLYYSNTGCSGDCLKKWQPALAPAGARPTGDWTLTGDGKDKQWAFHSKPAFFLTGAMKVDQASVLSDSDPTRPPPSGPRIVDDGLDGMKLALVDPQAWIKMPFSIGVAEYRLAPGEILAAGVAGNNPMGKPLYTFAGTAQQEQKLPVMFKPQYAATLDLPLGDFTIRERADGTRQWAFQGKPLYTCDCDRSPGDINGKGAVAGIAVATVVNYPSPAQVAIRKDNLSGGYFYEAATGKTLYYRDRMKDDYTPDHARAMQGVIDPGVGALLNTMHCDAKCEKEWHPLLAAKDAQPQGYWSIYLRKDGKRQWAYKNSALYTHATEKPGTLDGNETYTIAFDDGKRTTPVPDQFGLGLAWRGLVP